MLFPLSPLCDFADDAELAERLIDLVNQPTLKRGQAARIHPQGTPEPHEERIIQAAALRVLLGVNLHLGLKKLEELELSQTDSGYSLELSKMRKFFSRERGE